MFDNEPTANAAVCMSAYVCVLCLLNNIMLKIDPENLVLRYDNILTVAAYKNKPKEKYIFKLTFT